MSRIHIIKSCLRWYFSNILLNIDCLMKKKPHSLPPETLPFPFSKFVLFNMLVAVILLKIRKLLQKKMLCIVVAAMEYHIYIHIYVYRSPSHKKNDKQTLETPQNLIHWVWFVVYSRYQQHIINIVTIAQARKHTPIEIRVSFTL